MAKFNILSVWLLLGLTVLLVPLFYDHRKEQLLNILFSLSLAVGAYFVFCGNSCLKFAIYNLGFTAVGSYFLAKFGVFDARFAAKKFTYYHLLALILFGCLSISSVGSINGLILVIISFGILLAGCPFHGWLESFAMHAPSGLLAAYSAFIYPLDVFFALKLLSITLCAQNYYLFQRICLYAGAFGCLFVSILFFAKTENRRFWAYLVSWNTAIILLFLAYCSMLDYILIVQFAILQGLILEILGQSIVYLHRKLQNDRLMNLSEVCCISKGCHFFLKLSLCTSWFSPLLFAIFFVKMSIFGWCVLISSFVLYGFFLKNLLKNSPEKNYLSFK